MNAIFWCLGERRRQARAITTALSPLRTMLMTLICASEISASDMPGISIGQDPFLMADGQRGQPVSARPPSPRKVPYDPEPNLSSARFVRYKPSLQVV